MNSKDFSEFKKIVDIEELKQFYYYNGEKSTVEHYGISYGNFRELKKEHNIKIPKEISSQKKTSTWANKAEDKTAALCAKVSKDALFTYYEIENHTLSETAGYFNITQLELVRLISLYDIHKSKEAHTAQIKKSKLERHGDANFNNRAKNRETCLEKYGVPNVSQLDSTLEKMRETWAAHGFDHPMHVDEYKQKVMTKLSETDRLYNNNSSYNKKFEQLLIDNNIEYRKEVVLGNYRYDFQVRDILIEINPFPFHNVTWNPFGKVSIDKNYHQNKSLNALHNNLRCIHVWDWDSYEDIIKLLKPMDRVYARNCIIREVSVEESKDFIEANHVQGYTAAPIKLGLYYNKELVSIMTFGNPRYNKTFEYELIRYCSSKHVVGGAEKIFKHFIKTWSPQSIISYCDFSKFTGKTYEKLGFTKAKEVPPVSGHWYKDGQHILDSSLRMRGADILLHTDLGKGTSNEEIAESLGFVKIYDAGQFRYEWKNFK